MLVGGVVHWFSPSMGDSASNRSSSSAQATFGEEVTYSNDQELSPQVQRLKICIMSKGKCTTGDARCGLRLKESEQEGELCLVPLRT